MADNKRSSSVSINESDPKKAKKDDYTSNWLEAMSNCVHETQVDVLSLVDKGLSGEEVKAILEFLPDSEVIELNLDHNYLTDKMVELAPLLTRTKLRKLDVSSCGLSKSDILRLAEVLKDTEITSLIILGSVAVGDSFSLSEAQRFISYVRRSKLTALQFDSIFNLLPFGRNTSLAQDFLNTPITCLDVRKFSSDQLFSLFSNLSRSAVTEINIEGTAVSPEALAELSRKLVSKISNRRSRETKIEKLNLCRVGLTDLSLIVLAEGLVRSKVTDLDLQYQRFSRLDPLFTKIKETQIKRLNLCGNNLLRNLILIQPNSLQCSCLASLNLSRCELNDWQGEGLMESLRFSNVVELNVSYNQFGILTVQKLAGNITDINLIDLDISHNSLPLAGFIMLGKCLKKSKLTQISISNFSGIEYDNHQIVPANSSDLLSFLKFTEGSSINQIRMTAYRYTWRLSSAFELKMLQGTTFTELRLCSSNIGTYGLGLFSYLQFTAITNLNLSNNEIQDNGARVIAEFLKNSQIRRLNLSSNSITCLGAEALALSFKDTNLLCLNLNTNRIYNDGLESLAESAKNSFITELDVLYNPGKKILLVDKVLWENRISANKLVKVFQQIAPQINSDEFCFDQTCESEDVFGFLEKCMGFYKTVVDKPAAITVLLEEKSESFSREQIFKLVFEDFPRQFSSFIACRIEADLTEHVRILEKVEELGLTVVVESLLIHRPIYTLDEEQGILHPYVYKLLLKYKQPICNLAIEPQGIVKIMKYFIDHADIVDAQDLIKLLQDAPKGF